MRTEPTYRPLGFPSSMPYHAPFSVEREAYSSDSNTQLHRHQGLGRALRLGCALAHWWRCGRRRRHGRASARRCAGAVAAVAAAAAPRSRWRWVEVVVGALLAPPSGEEPAKRLPRRTRVQSLRQGRAGAAPFPRPATLQAALRSCCSCPQ